MGNSLVAPANLGSPLAAKGKSLVGRIAKGCNNWFETGSEMLNALELASPPRNRVHPVRGLAGP